MLEDYVCARQDLISIEFSQFRQRGNRMRPCQECPHFCRVEWNLYQLKGTSPKPVAAWSSTKIAPSGRQLLLSSLLLCPQRFGWKLFGKIAFFHFYCILCFEPAKSSVCEITQRTLTSHTERIHVPGPAISPYNRKDLIQAQCALGSVGRKDPSKIKCSQI